jgi:hypothetical protein
MSDVRTYSDAMRVNNVCLALLIEERHGLVGFPPEIVSGILAIMEDKDVSVYEATDMYFDRQ